MSLWNIVPTWFDIERRMTHRMGYQSGASFQRGFNNEPVPTLHLNLRRISTIRTAFIRAEWEAARLLGRRFADIDLSSIINDLIDVVSQMAMIVTASTLAGGAIGAGIGVGFFGAGAVPMGMAGAAIGLELSTWILGILGLASIAEFFIDGLPRIVEHYVRGIKVAWEGLQNAGPRRGALDKPESPPPPPPPNRRADEQEPKKPLGMAEHKVPCFNVSDKHLDRIPEFDRQLAGQEKGLNNLTVDEYLKGRKAFTDGDAVRDPKVTRDARRAFSLDMEIKFRNQLRLEGKPLSEVATLAKKMASEKMATLAALHNPDLFAGGKDIIGDFGDRRINSSIGSQWPSRITGLDTAASNIPDINRGTTKVNAKLNKC